MKITNKILLLVLILAVTLSFGVVKNSYADETDDDGYIDLNNVEPDDSTTTGTETEKKDDKEQTQTPTQTQTQTPATTGTEAGTQGTTENKAENVVNVNKTNTATNTANPTNQATTNHPQTGDFVDVKIIAGVSIAAFAVVFAFAKLKKYSY